MKKLTALGILFGILVSTNVFAANLAYDCEVRDFTNPKAFSDVTLTLDGQSGKVVDSLTLSTGKYRVQVELYFQSIQIYLRDESDSLIFSSTAPDTTPVIRTSLYKVARITCKRH